MEVKPLHLLKASFPIDVTLSPRMISLIEYKSLNQESPTDGHKMVTEVKLLQLAKAFSPIDVTLLGMVMEVKPLQPLKDSLPIDVTSSPNMISLM